VPDHGLKIQELRIAPDPASTVATILPFKAKCEIRTLVYSDALGRVLEQPAWGGTKPIVIEQECFGTTFVRAIDEHGRTCSTGRIAWIAR